jgi:uncharacterized protein YoxC
MFLLFVIVSVFFSYEINKLNTTLAENIKSTNTQVETIKKQVEKLVSDTENLEVKITELEDNTAIKELESKYVQIASEMKEVRTTLSKLKILDFQ